MIVSFLGEILRYDFPRSHQVDHGNDGKTGKDAQRRHCYSNAAPGELSSSSSSAVAAAAEIFTFNNNAVTAGLSAASAMSPSVYSNLASPFPLASPALLPMTPFSPPSVNRTLKPKTQSSGAAGVVDGPLPPPSVNRQLKPNRKWSRLRSIDFLGVVNDANLLFSPLIRSRFWCRTTRRFPRKQFGRC